MDSNLWNRRDFIDLLGKLGGSVSLGAVVPASLLGNDVDAKSATLDELLDHRVEHPRLHLRAAEWVALRSSIQADPILKQWYDELQAAAGKMMMESPASFRLDGPRLLTQSRLALLRISTLAALYRLDGDKRKADRAKEELLAICAFPSWHPPHFLDVAEMTNAAALGYDWLYDVLSEKDRQLLRSKIVEFGLAPGLAEYQKNVGWSRSNANNWGQVCASGLACGALAILGDDGNDPGGPSALPRKILKLTTASIPGPMKAYAPDGGWPEGPMYWGYATQYTCNLLSALNSALGTDLGLSRLPGFSETGDFRIATIGPSGLTFNYADATPTVIASPAMLWLARRFNRPIYAMNEVAQVKRSQPDIFHLIWSQPHMSNLSGALPALDWLFSSCQVACLRSSWTNPDAFFLGIKGGSNQASHGHLDLGTFVMDALGERWALDLGSDDYDLPDYFGAKRWDYYRLRTEGHNTLTLGSQNQPLAAEASIAQYESTPKRGEITCDLSPAYAGSFTKVTRHVVLERSPIPKVTITDSSTGEVGRTMRWNFHTRARIRLVDKQAILELNGKRLIVTLHSPAAATFKVISANPPRPQGQQPSVRNLTVEYTNNSPSFEFVVTLEGDRSAD